MKIGWGSIQSNNQRTATEKMLNTKLFIEYYTTNRCKDDQFETVLEFINTHFEKAKVIRKELRREWFFKRERRKSRVRGIDNHSWHEVDDLVGFSPWDYK